MSMTSAASRTEAGLPLGTGSGLGMQRLKRIIPHLWCSPVPVYSVENGRAAAYLHALFGLRDRRAQYINSTFASQVLQLFVTFERHWLELVDDIERGTLSADLGLPAVTRQALERCLPPDPIRAGELRAAAAPGFEGIARRAWPRLAYVTAVISGSMAAYALPLRHYVGDLPIFSFYYGASEALMGINLWPHRPDDYVLYPGGSYMEFIPLAETDQSQPQAVGVEGLETGESYEIVVTNGAGFYRYRMGDIVRVIGFCDQAPALNFSHRRGVALDLAGEKTTEPQLHAALTQLPEAWLPGAGRLRDYATSADLEARPPRYVFYIERLPAPARPDGELALGEASCQLDAALCQANSLFALYRRRESVGAPQVKLLAPGSFDRLHETLLERHPSRNSSQIKIPRCLADAQLIALLETQVIAAS